VPGVHLDEIAEGPYSEVPRYFVEPTEDARWVVSFRREDGPATVAGPYLERKTANRRARQLNGEDCR